MLGLVAAHDFKPGLSLGTWVALLEWFDAEFSEERVALPLPWRRNGLFQGMGGAFSLLRCRIRGIRASLAPSNALAGGLPLHVRSNAAHLAIDESAQNNYERRCIRPMNLP
jgi:hypothetical protein